MERKVNKKFKPNITKIYKYKGQYIGDRPRGTILKYWIYDDIEKEYIGVLRSPCWIVEFITVLIIILTILVVKVQGDMKLDINIPEVMYCYNNKLEANITNNSLYIIEVVFDSNKGSTFKTSIMPGNSIGTVLVDIPKNLSGAVPFIIRVNKDTGIGFNEISSKEVLINIVRD